MPESNQTSSLSTSGARQLSTTTKSPPQHLGSTPRWLVRQLPWVATEAGVYRVNRRLRYDIGTEVLPILAGGGVYGLDPGGLGAIHLLRNFANTEVLLALALAFQPEVYEPGQDILELGDNMDAIVVLAHGRADKLSEGEFGDIVSQKLLGEGEYFGERLLAGADDNWSFGLRARTACVVLRMSQDVVAQFLANSPELAAHISGRVALEQLPQDSYHQPAMPLLVGHEGEATIPWSFVDYEPKPGEIELSVAQTILRMHTRVSDLHNHPHDQLEQQLRLTIEELRERQEFELVNNPTFGLLANVAHDQRLYAQPGPPSPDDLDELICRRKQSNLILAHPKAISAFTRECTRRSVMTEHDQIDGQRVLVWRGVPVLPCDKLPISPTGQSTILCLRTGAEREGVIGLHQPGIPDEVEASLNVRFMGLDDAAVASYLVSLYFGLAILVPDAYGALLGVEVT